MFQKHPFRHYIRDEKMSFRHEYNDEKVASDGNLPVN